MRGVALGCSAHPTGRGKTAVVLPGEALWAGLLPFVLPKRNWQRVKGKHKLSPRSREEGWPLSGGRGLTGQDQELHHRSWLESEALNEMKKYLPGWLFYPFNYKNFERTRLHIF